MKAIICEMCNSNNVVKEDGVYVCQSCGTKYSVDEAKKLMVEVEGTVKIDKSDYVTKSLMNARRARQKEDWEETEKYYNKVEEEDPGNIEAIFYSSYGKAKYSLIESDIYKREAAFKVLTNSISIIDDNFDAARENEQLEIIKEIANAIIKMESSSYVYKTRNNSEDAVKTELLFAKLGVEFAETLLNISRKATNNKQVYLQMAAEHLIYLNSNFYSQINNTYVKNKLDSIAATCDDDSLKLACWKMCLKCSITDEEMFKYQDLCHSIDPNSFSSSHDLRAKMSSEQEKAAKATKAKRIFIISLVILFIIAMIFIAFFMK